jgi:tetratricopeptide (TPR) repeat protein
LHRKILDIATPVATMSALRARIIGFGVADEKGKVAQICQLLSTVVETREAVIFHDRGGLLDHSGEFQAAIRKILPELEQVQHPPIVFIAERMIPQGKRTGVDGIVYCPLPALKPAEVRQLSALLLKANNIPYTNDDLEEIVELSDGHPFNVKFIVEAAKEYTLRVFLANTEEFSLWKRRRGAQFLQKIDFSELERRILAVLKNFVALDFNTLAVAAAADVGSVGRAVARLIDLHVIEVSADTYLTSPPLKMAVERDPRFVLPRNIEKQVLRAISQELTAMGDGGEVSASMVNAGILATLQEDGDVPELFSAFLLPSHLVWLARRKYDSRQYEDCIRLAVRALEGKDRLSATGKIEACRSLCLAASRQGREGDFANGIAVLRREVAGAFARSNLNFLLGFNARLNGNLPEAERYQRDAYDDDPGNFHAARELASICVARGDLESAEMFARRAFDVAPDNAYILDILLSVLIKSPRGRSPETEGEIADLFERLQRVGEQEGHSFYTTRRAEYELTRGNIDVACKLIDEAAEKTPSIFNVHLLRAEIYLERCNKIIAQKEISKMRDIVYNNPRGERRTNLRPLLVMEAEYNVATGDYDGARQLYRTQGVFTAEEAQAAIKRIDQEEAYRRRR